VGVIPLGYPAVAETDRKALRRDLTQQHLGPLQDVSSMLLKGVMRKKQASKM
jgi:hypothetical protein